MRTKLISDGQRSDAWQYRARDLAFTTMLIAQCLIIFAIPIAAMGYEGVREVVALLFFVFTFLVCLISPGRVATILAILAFISGLVGYVLEQNDEWQLQHRYMQVEVMAGLATAAEATDPRQIPCAA